MQEYQIRILRADRTTAIIMDATHFSDRAAIQAAKKLAQACPFEVWRELDCIHGRGVAAALPSQSRMHAA